MTEEDIIQEFRSKKNRLKSIIIKKNKKRHNEIALLAKKYLHCIKGSISRSSTDSYIG